MAESARRKFIQLLGLIAPDIPELSLDRIGKTVEAFSEEIAFNTSHERMTLRDQFAMAALNGLLTGDPLGGDADAEGWNEKSITRHAYIIADAMLAARGGR